MSGNFPPDYFAPDFFTPDYFGGETNENAMAASIAGAATVTADLTSGQVNIAASLSGSSSVTSTISVAAAQAEDDGFLDEYLRVHRKRRERAAKVVVPVQIAARIVGRSVVVASAEAPRVAWAVECASAIRGTCTLTASIDGPDRIEEQDLQDLEDLVDLYMLMAA